MMGGREVANSSDVRGGLMTMLSRRLAHPSRQDGSLERNIHGYAFLATWVAFILSLGGAVLVPATAAASTHIAANKQWQVGASRDSSRNESHREKSSGGNDPTFGPGVAAYDNYYANPTNQSLWQAFCTGGGGSTLVMGVASFHFPACGPTGNTTIVIPTAPGATGVTSPGFQCTELADRYLAVTYGLFAPANAVNGGGPVNGDQVVATYGSTYHLPTYTSGLAAGQTSATSGYTSMSGVNHAPQAGEVMSFSANSTFLDGSGTGHVGLVVSSTVNSTGTGTIQVLNQDLSINGGSPTAALVTMTVTNWVVQPLSGSGLTHFEWLGLTAQNAPAPAVLQVSPQSGPIAGGTAVTIRGTSFEGVTSVKFGAHTATIVGHTATSISARAPAGAVGTVDVTVTTPRGTSATSSADKFTYVPPAPTVTKVSPTTGTSGTSVTITGTNFVGTPTVKFGTASASNITVVSATSITAKAPSGTGTVNVIVTTAGGTSAASSANSFTYATVPAAPTITTATAGNAQVTLVWSAPSNGGSTITGYNVYKGTTMGGESQTAVNSSQVTTLSYTVKGLTNGTKYFFKVKAENMVGLSAYSNEVSATPVG